MDALMAIGNSTSNSVFIPPVPISMSSVINAVNTASCSSLVDSLVRQANPSQAVILNSQSPNTNLQQLIQKSMIAAQSHLLDNCTNGSKPCDESPLEALCGKRTFQDETRRKFFMQLLLNRHFEPAEKIANQLEKSEKDAAFYLLSIEAGDAGLFDLAEQFRQRRSGNLSKITSFLGMSDEPSFERVLQLADQGNFATAINELRNIPEEMNRKILTHAIRGAVTKQIQQLITSHQREEVNAILAQIPSRLLDQFRAYWRYVGLLV